MRFEEVDNEVVERVTRVINEDFTNLQGCKIGIIFDTKKRKTKGKYTVSKLSKTNELQKFLTETVSSDGQGYDYILTMDQTAYLAFESDDRDRIICNALYHADVDFDATDPYKLRNAEIMTFHEELRKNDGDMSWGERIQLVTASAHGDGEEGVLAGEVN
jgi:hypothetical protein